MQFSPSETASITGLWLTLQRDWRSQGHIPPRTTGQARFSPLDLAEIRAMMQLRRLGMGPSESRPIAQKASPSILFEAINADKLEDSIAVADNSERGRRYMNFLAGPEGDKYLRIMAGLEREPYLFALIQDGDCKFLEEIHDEVVGRSAETAGLLNLSAIGKAIVTAAPRPLFTVIVPASFK